MSITHKRWLSWKEFFFFFHSHGPHLKSQLLKYLYKILLIKQIFYIDQSNSGPSSYWSEFLTENRAFFCLLIRRPATGPELNPTKVLQTQAWSISGSITAAPNHHHNCQGHMPSNWELWTEIKSQLPNMANRAHTQFLGPGPSDTRVNSLLPS